ncbi:MAG: glycerol-3-phosphate dehydrogenase [Sphingomonadaceae bacterium]|nr:glycerol-3-phosphate dehydrogenase [Sphingomonadaceae bacterium]
MRAHYDLLVIGGGANGAGVARDAAGRGLSVLLVEKDDLASHTSSASTKLIHGGLRYLEYYEFRLVRESLIERAKLLKIAPHIIWPLRFVLPQPEGGRPAWLIRLGLMLYDTIGGFGALPASRGVRLAGTPLGAGLKSSVRRGFAYSDCWVEDSRLVVLNALDAHERGADICTRTRFVSATRGAESWTAVIEGAGGQRTVEARAIANLAGPWVAEALGSSTGASPEQPPRLVRGSHIIVPRMFAGEHAYILQNRDGRIVFAIPYEGEFTLIGTTDVSVASPADARISDDEVRYLCESVNAYFARSIGPGDVRFSYSGVRPLYDDGRGDPSAVTRDYTLKLGAAGSPQIVSAFGGKITTYRRLSEHLLEMLAPYLPPMGPGWTAAAPLPGGDMADFAVFFAGVRARWPWLPEATARRMARAYGTRLERVLAGAASWAALGRDYGGGLTEAELDYLVRVEWARTAEDVLWRRSKLKLHVGPGAASTIDDQLGAGPAA